MPKSFTPQTAYESVQTILEALSVKSNSEAYLNFHKIAKEKLLTAPASRNGHHFWEGGYIIHIAEVLDVMVDILSSKKTSSMMPSADECLIAGYIHDLDKLWRYKRSFEPGTEKQIGYAQNLGVKDAEKLSKSELSEAISAKKEGRSFQSKNIQQFDFVENSLPHDDASLVIQILDTHYLPYTEEIASAITFHHGGWAPITRAYPFLMPSPLASVLHAADMISANVLNGGRREKPASKDFTDLSPL